MKTVLSFVALFGSALAQWNHEIRNENFALLNLHSSFEDFKQRFNQVYTAEEEFKRFSIFSQTLKDIAQFNSEEHSSRVRANQFAALTDEEFKLKMFGPTGSCLKPGEHIPIIGNNQMVRDGEYEPNAGGTDWTAQGCVTSVKYQESCGSCWAFSTTGAVECAEAVKQSGGGRCLEKPVSLSEQQLVDCDWGNGGCNGGDMGAAMDYIEYNGGICTDRDYPYTALDGSCKQKNCGTKHQISKHTWAPTNSESALMAAIDKGCVSVGIQADQFAFRYYSSGVMDGTCGTRVNHGVLATGYGTAQTNEGPKDFWKVKNSWDTTWGDNGYILMCRNCGKNHGQGQCAILSEPVYPTI